MSLETWTVTGVTQIEASSRRVKWIPFSFFQFSSAANVAVFVFVGTEDVDSCPVGLAADSDGELSVFGCVFCGT
jgi:hypothetical protein